jgi:hypothetical protein
MEQSRTQLGGFRKKAEYNRKRNGMVLNLNSDWRSGRRHMLTFFVLQFL